MSQLVAFNYWITLLVESGQFKSNNDSHKIIFQDPSFGMVDHQFLVSMGLDSRYDYQFGYSAAQLKMTSETFLFVPVGNERDLIVECLKTAYPALLIRHRIEKTQDQRTETAQTWKKTLEWPVCGRVKLSDTIFEEEFKRREIVWPFYDTHSTRSLWSWTDRDPRTGRYDSGRARKMRARLSPGLQWTWEMWVSWRPDNKSRLKGCTDLYEGQDCQCFFCRAEGLPELSDRPWRAPSPVTLAEGEKDSIEVSHGG